MKQDLRGLEEKTAECTKQHAYGKHGSQGGTTATFATTATVGAAIVGTILGDAFGAVAGIRLARKAGKTMNDMLEQQISNKAGSRFLKRGDTSWYPTVERFIFDYIRGTIRERCLQNFIVMEELEIDLREIRTYMMRWVSQAREKCQT